MSARIWTRLSIVIGAAGAPLTAQAADAAPGKWNVDSDTSALTDLPTVSAHLVSEKPLINMVGTPEPATLILRCRDRVVAAYVTWPEVVNHDMDNLAGDPKTLVYWKLDDGPIGNSLWSISSTGDAAGAFNTNAATKLMTGWRSAHRLVVRMSGRTTQDAVFATDGIDAVAAQVLTACGTAAGRNGATAALNGPAAFSPGVTVSISQSNAAVLSSARALLQRRGFKTAQYDAGAGTLITEAKEALITSKQANCGGVFGIPYLADRRAHPTLAYRVEVAGGRLTVEAAIGGIYKGAAGAADTSLRCTSKELLERDLAVQLGADPSTASERR